MWKNVDFCSKIIYIHSLHYIFVEKLNIFKMPLKFILMMFSKNLSDTGSYSICWNVSPVITEALTEAD